MNNSQFAYSSQVSNVETSYSQQNTGQPAVYPHDFSVFPPQGVSPAPVMPQYPPPCNNSNSNGGPSNNQIFLEESNGPPAKRPKTNGNEPVPRTTESTNNLVKNRRGRPPKYAVNASSSSMLAPKQAAQGMMEPSMMGYGPPTTSSSQQNFRGPPFSGSYYPNESVANPSSNDTGQQHPIVPNQRIQDQDIPHFQAPTGHTQATVAMPQIPSIPAQPAIDTLAPSQHLDDHNQRIHTERQESTICFDLVPEPDFRILDDECSFGSKEFCQSMELVFVDSDLCRVTERCLKNIAVSEGLGFIENVLISSSDPNRILISGLTNKDIFSKVMQLYLTILTKTAWGHGVSFTYIIKRDTTKMEWYTPRQIQCPKF